MFSYSMMNLDETKLHAFFCHHYSPFPSKKKRQRKIKRKGSNGGKKMHGVPFHLILLHSVLTICLANPSILRRFADKFNAIYAV